MISKLDLLVRGGTVVTPDGLVESDLGVADGRIVALAPLLDERAREEIDARGLTVFPGMLDAHVHFNEPGRTDWEGLATGSAALAAGGGTCFFDMPLNSLPPVLDAASFALKREAAERSSCLDFALWGGLVPGNLDRLEELRDAGAVGLKAFLCASGVDEFEAITNPATLRTGMKRAASLDLLVAVHAEDEALARRFLQRHRNAAPEERGTSEERRHPTNVGTRPSTGGGAPLLAGSARRWLASRPVELELAAIHTVLDLAGETGCRLHVVHVSSPEGLALIAEAKAQGVDVTAETCPHYLLLNEDDVERLGAVAKCAPPVRDEARRVAMWEALARGEVDTIGSDHSPAPPAMKQSEDFFEIWGGISGCQHGFAMVVSEALRTATRGDPALALPHLARLLAENVAQRFGIRGKGRIAVGYDADFTLLDASSEVVLRNEQLRYRHRQGPYDGRPCGVRVRRTLLRGQTVFDSEETAFPSPWVRFLRPQR